LVRYFTVKGKEIVTSDDDDDFVNPPTKKKQKYCLARKEENTRKKAVCRILEYKIEGKDQLLKLKASL
jgi:hypothetical protein